MWKQEYVRKVTNVLFVENKYKFIQIIEELLNENIEKFNAGNA
jgi:hypothetical protein